MEISFLQNLMFTEVINKFSVSDGILSVIVSDFTQARQWYLSRAGESISHPFILST
jgi:hypothetical protein